MAAKLAGKADGMGALRHRHNGGKAGEGIMTKVTKMTMPKNVG